jgi:hypothetical protein
MDMRKSGFALLATFNRWFLPKLSGKDIDLTKLTATQKALVAWRYWVTKNNLS